MIDVEYNKANADWVKSCTMKMDITIQNENLMLGWH